jgi:hypothetical protein
MDRPDCDPVEADPEKVAEQLVVKGTRESAGVVLIDEEYGRTPEQTHASPGSDSRKTRCINFSRPSIPKMPSGMTPEVCFDLTCNHHASSPGPTGL